MSQRARLDRLEGRAGPPEGIVLVVYRTPPGFDDEPLFNAYVRSHPDAVDRVLEYPRSGVVIQTWGEQRQRYRAPNDH
jgi:hypothetical protein